MPVAISVLPEWAQKVIESNYPRRIDITINNENLCIVKGLAKWNGEQVIEDDEFQELN